MSETTVSGPALAAAGAAPDEVDPAALLAQIRGLQAKMDAMEAQKRAENAPAVVTYAQAAADHVGAIAAAHPHLAADPDHPLSRGPVLAGIAAEAATAEAAGTRGALAKPLADLESWVHDIARVRRHIDFGYVLQLVAEAGRAAAALGG